MHSAHISVHYGPRVCHMIPPLMHQIIHEQYTGVHDERARSVHTDPDLAAVIAAWPTLAAAVRATILQLVATEEVAP